MNDDKEDTKPEGEVGRQEKEEKKIEAAINRAENIRDGGFKLKVSKSN